MAKKGKQQEIKKSAPASEKVKAYSGSGKDNVLLFTLSEATEVDLIESTDQEWAHIRLADGKQGWVKRQALKTGG